MRIVLHTLLAGPKGVRQPGIHEVSDDEAKTLIDAKYADVAPPEEKKEEKKDGPAGPETAAVKPPETATPKAPSIRPTARK
jgi:hypothetical protein